jgi:phosphatidylserine decarboxylase
VYSDYLKKISQYVLPKQLLTMFAGYLADVRIPFIKNYLIKSFINHFDVNMYEAVEENPVQYPTFNDFFIRQIKPNCRPISSAEVICPVDGAVSEIGRIEQGQMLQAKGRHYTVGELLAVPTDQSLNFQQGSFATLYLSPKDYHRIHMPMDAELRSMIHIPGTLFSVQPATTRVIPRLFARNERLVIFFDTSHGAMAMVLVGATIVGAIGTSWHGDLTRGIKRKSFDYGQNNPVYLKKAQEMGYFKLGSTVILLFEEHVPIQWSIGLLSGSSVKVGQELAHLT